jgi:hypothetical protein
MWHFPTFLICPKNPRITYISGRRELYLADAMQPAVSVSRQARKPSNISLASCCIVIAAIYEYYMYYCAGAAGCGKRKSLARVPVAFRRPAAAARASPWITPSTLSFLSYIQYIYTWTRCPSHVYSSSSSKLWRDNPRTDDLLIKFGLIQIIITTSNLLFFVMNKSVI